MRRLSYVAFAAILLVGLGCQEDSGDGWSLESGVLGAFTGPLSFGSTITLNNGGNNGFGEIASPDLNHVYAIWQNDLSGRREFYFKRSVDGGVSFQPALQLSAATVAAVSPFLAANGSSVHVAWIDQVSGTSDVIYRRSSDYGATFSAVVNLSMTSGTSSAPMLAVSGPDVFLLWSEVTGGSGRNEIFFRHSSDGGASFQPTVNVSATTGYSRYPHMAVDGSNVYVAWCETKYDAAVLYYGDVWFRRSIDKGATFGPAIQLSNTPGRSGEPGFGKPGGEVKIAASGGHVYVTWGDTLNYDDLNTDVLFARSSDGGITFSSAINLSNNVANSREPQIAANGATVHIVCTDYDVTGDIAYFRSTDGGSTFATVNLSNNSSYSNQPRLIASGDNLIVSWNNRTSSTYYDVFLRKSADRGATFESSMNVSGTYYDSMNPRISAAAGTDTFQLNVLWLEEVDWGFKYRRGVIGSSDTTVPTCAITAPASGTTYTSAQTVTISASASDNVGVTKVEFYDNGTLEGTDTTSPYSFAWSITSANNGPHSWTAKAFDAAGNATTSAAISLTVNIPIADTTPPTCSITSPASGTMYTTAQTVTISASASDNVGVARVEFLRNGALMGSDATSPYSFAWAITSAQNGSHSWTARAFDAAGNGATSSAVSLTVSIAVTDITPPAAPTGLTVTRTRVKCVYRDALSWNANTESDLASYRLYRATSSTGPYTLVSTVARGTTSISLGAGKKPPTYYYVLRAVDSSNNESPASSTVTAS